MTYNHLFLYLYVLYFFIYIESQSYTLQLLELQLGVHHFVYYTLIPSLFSFVLIDEVALEWYCFEVFQYHPI